MPRRIPSPTLTASTFLFGLALTASMQATAVKAQVSGGLPAYVKLQAVTPGSQQSGNANLSGKVRAGSFEGNGATITGLNANNVSSGLLASSFGGLGIDTSAATPGSLLWNDGLGWNLLAMGNEGDVLTVTGGLPGWIPSSGGGLSLPYAGSADDGGADSLFKVTDSGAGAAVFGQTDNPTGAGVRGEATDNSDYSFGGYFTAASPNGRAVNARNDSTTGQSVAGRFGSASPDSLAVYSTASSSSGDAIAIYGESFAVSGTGVRGVALATVPNRQTGGVEGFAYAPDGAGVWGYNGSLTGRATGLFASSQNISNGSAALLVFGNSAVLGTKQFMIDHPLDPTNKALHHYCTEGPAPYNVYKGRVRTDAAGYAWVRLPDYYEAINRDPDFQLTVVDSSADFVLAKITQEIKNGQFQVRTSKPGVTVCWEVKATRNDRWVQQNGYVTEEDKLPGERGKYFVPKLYGQPDSNGVFGARADATQRIAAKPDNAEPAGPALPE